MRRRRLERPPPPPEGKLWDNKRGWIPIGEKEFAAIYRLRYTGSPNWRQDPSYHWARQARARKAAKAKE